MSDLKNKINQAVIAIKERTKIKPKVGVILGTGLDDFVKRVNIEVEIPYDDIPYFPRPTVKSHVGKLVIGKTAGKNVAVIRGRLHYYEGRTLEEITFPVRVLRKLGAEILIVSNASGGLNPLFKTSDLMLITDHINFTGLNPLVGFNDEELGPRFPDMSKVYDKKLIELALQTALENNIKIEKGVYIGVTGPNLETPAEYRMMRGFGSDAVGMSTVHEVIAAVHSGFKILGISCITDLCLPDALEPVNIEKIIKAANNANPKLSKLIEKFIKKI